MAITVDEFNKLRDKAKTKKDGVYSMKPYNYVVKNNVFIGYCEWNGDMYQALYGFTTKIGKVEYRVDQKKELKRVFDIK